MKPTMTIDQVYEFLCLRDPRSPWCSERVAANPEEYPPRGRDCRCSACESGSDQLAMFTLELLGEQ